MIRMEISNKSAVEESIRISLDSRLENALKGLVDEIIDELPKGHSSSIADKLIVKKIGPCHYQVEANDVWIWLNDGTGIYGPHKGRGPGGAIVPINAKSLHFRNREIAAALGFPTEDVFLQMVRGISPRFYWDRYFRKGRISEKFASAKP